MRSAFTNLGFRSPERRAARVVTFRMIRLSAFGWKDAVTTTFPFFFGPETLKTKDERWILTGDPSSCDRIRDAGLHPRHCE